MTVLDRPAFSLVSARDDIVTYVVNDSEEDRCVGVYRILDLLWAAGIKLSETGESVILSSLRNLNPRNGTSEENAGLIAFKAAFYGREQLVEHMVNNPKETVQALAQEIFEYLGATSPESDITCHTLYDLITDSCICHRDDFCLCGDAHAMCYTLAIVGGSKLREFMQKNPRQ